MIARRTLLGSALALAVVPMANAHRAHVTLSRISRNQKTGAWEIEHRLHYHDAEIALRRQKGAARLQLTSLEGKARMALHVEEHFALFGPDSVKLPVTTVGADFDGDSFVVLQELEQPPKAGPIRARITILQTVFSQQSNRLAVALSEPSLFLLATAAAPSVVFRL
jgi:hypothetical protein